MMPQGAWRKIFKELRRNNLMARLIMRVFEEQDQQRRITLVDELYASNQGQIKRLTGKSGVTISLFLAAYDPFNNLSIASLNDRRQLGFFKDSDSF